MSIKDDLSKEEHDCSLCEEEKCDCGSITAEDCTGCSECVEEDDDEAVDELESDEFDDEDDSLDVSFI